MAPTKEKKIVDRTVYSGKKCSHVALSE